VSEPALLTDWPAVFTAGAAEAGGKAWNLARLARYGLPVPEGLVIPASACRRWLADGGPGSVESRERLPARPLPPGLGAALDAAIAARGWRGRPLAVRSSACAEDSAAASFAGIHLSRLNVTGREALERAVREVWASLLGNAAVAYRQRMGMAQADAAMAVIVMPLLPAAASGIAFTADPRAGRDDRLLIHANHGLGETLVAGTAEGDEAIIAEHPEDDGLALLGLRIGSKTHAAWPAPGGGTRRVALAASARGHAVLDEPALLELAALARDAALALDFADPGFDVEWAFDGSRFWLLQARPITARVRNTYPALAARPGIWSRGNTCEVVPEPLSPIDWCHSRRVVNALLEEGYRLAGYPLRPGLQRAALHHGRLYLNTALMQWEAYDALGLAPEAMNELMGGHQPAIGVPAPGLPERLARLGRMARYLVRSPRMRRRGEREIRQALERSAAWRLTPLAGDEGELLERLRRQTREARSARGIFFLQASSGGSLAALVALVERHLPGEGHAIAAALLAGGPPSTTAEQGHALVELARIAAADPHARAWLKAPERASGQWASALPEDTPFRAAFTDFLERYGHRGLYESYFRNPRWREEPASLLDTVRDLMDSGMAALRPHHREAGAAARARLRAVLPRWKRPLLRALVRAAGREGNQREAARSALMALMEPARATLLAIGRRLHARGALPRPEAVFNLTLAEIERAVTGRVPPAGLAARTLDRDAALAAWAAQEAPDVILDHGDGRSVPAGPSARPPTEEGESFTGIAVGTGRAEGRARVLRSPAKGHRLVPGEVLVAPSTDPGWTPLFLKAGALVVETGGYLSHGAIVARELGIPAVVNLPGILQRLETGDWLAVDGVGGRVTRLSPPPAARGNTEHRGRGGCGAPGAGP